MSYVNTANAMEPREIIPLIYFMDRRLKRTNLLTWIACLLMMGQIAWFFPAAKWQDAAIFNDQGNSRRPLRDLCLYSVTALPSILAAVISYCDWRNKCRRRCTVRSLVISIILFGISASFVAIFLMAWIQDDVINRHLPYSNF